MNQLNYKCPKCNNRTYIIDEFRATGGFFTKVFNVQNKKFSTVTCERCTYTEIYKSDSSTLGNVFDFFVG